MSRIVAIAVSKTEGLASPVDERFGRAPAFLLVEEDTKEVVEELVNRAAEDAHGAGTGSARELISRGVQVVIAGRFGPKAESALRSVDAKLYSAAPGIPASAALEKLAQGSLSEVSIKVYR